MDGIHTLQEYMLHTKNIIYVLVVLILLAMPAIWRFLSDRGED